MDGKCFMKKIAAPVVRLCRGCDSGVRLDKGTSGSLALKQINFVAKM